MSFPPNPNFDKFVYKSSDLRTNRPVKEQFIQVTDDGSFETFVNSYLYKTVGNKYELLGDSKIVIQETDEVVITNKNGKIVKVIKDPVNSSEEKETIEVIEDGETIIKTFTTLYYSYEKKSSPEPLCGNLIDVTTEFYLNRSLPSVFNFSINTDKIFTDQILRNTFNGNNQWFGVSRTRSTSSPEVIVQIGTDGTILEVFECPLPTEVSTDIRTVSINFEDPEKIIPVTPPPVDVVFPERLPDPGPPTVSATFNSDDGSQINPQSGPSPLYVSQPPNPTKTNFNFNGFSPTLPAVITQDTVFTAIFTPVPPTIGLPDITTSNASSRKSDSAVIGGNVINANNGPIESRGSVFREIIFEGTGFSNSSQIDNILGTQTPKIKPEPLQGVINTGTGDIFVYNGTIWEENNKLDINNNTGITSDGEGLGVFISELEGLNSGRKYIYKAYATNTGNNGVEQISFGLLKEFRTTPLDIQTAVPFDITPISAKAGGLITNTGDLTVLSRGLLLIKSSQGTSSLSGTLTLERALAGNEIGGQKIILIQDPGDLANSLFRLDLGELEPGKDYRVRAFATNARGTQEGGIKTFTTLPKPKASLQLGNINNQATFVDVTFEIKAFTETEFGKVFEIGLLALPGHSGAAPDFDLSGDLRASRKGTINIYPSSHTISLRNLTPNSPFRVRAYAINDGGPGFSNVFTITTLPLTTLAQSPTVIFTSFTALGGNTFSATGDILDYGAGGSAPNSPNKGAQIRIFRQNDPVDVRPDIKDISESPPGIINLELERVDDANEGDTVEVRLFAANNIIDTNGNNLIGVSGTVRSFTVSAAIQPGGGGPGDDGLGSD